MKYKSRLLLLHKNEGKIVYVVFVILLMWKKEIDSAKTLFLHGVLSTEYWINNISRFSRYFWSVHFGMTGKSWKHISLLAIVDENHKQMIVWNLSKLSVYGGLTSSVNVTKTVIFGCFNPLYGSIITVASVVRGGWFSC